MDVDGDYSGNSRGEPNALGIISYRLLTGLCECVCIQIFEPVFFLYTQLYASRTRNRKREMKEPQNKEYCGQMNESNSKKVKKITNVWQKQTGYWSCCCVTPYALCFHHVVTNNSTNHSRQAVQMMPDLIVVSCSQDWNARRVHPWLCSQHTDTFVEQVSESKVSCVCVCVQMGWECVETYTGALFC